MTAHAPYWPLATLAFGILAGVLLHSVWTAWEDGRSGR